MAKKTNASYYEWKDNLLKEIGRRKDLWMVKTIYLVYVLKCEGIDVDWILQFEDKQELYNRLEILFEELNQKDKSGSKTDVQTP